MSENEMKVITLPLGKVRGDHLVRDRIIAEAGPLNELMTSIRAHGQRAPIEVMALADGSYGLISGWRRLTAIELLRHQTGEARFDTILAFLRTPSTAGDAYVAMVEENEIRVGLSFLERARIVDRAVEAGVYATDREALAALFSSASRAKRSKIGSFLTIWRSLGPALMFPTALSERAGLALVRALEADPGLAGRLRRKLRAADPQSAEDEAKILHVAEREPGRTRQGGNSAQAAVPAAVAPGLSLARKDSAKGAELVISGTAVTPAFERALIGWLRAVEDRDHT